jgi:amino acid adenylation domain-containing protein
MEEAGTLALTSTEELIAGVWSNLLGKSEIRRDDNFFHLGGHSLTSIQMLARLEQVFHREIELRALFEFPVLKDFAAYVDQLTGPAPVATLQPIVPTSRDGRLPLSFAQQRLWFLAQMEGGSAAYHIPFGLHLKGDLNRAALGRALDRILVRHEVLRTSFGVLDGEPVQEIGAVEESNFRLIEHDLRGHDDVEAELAVLSEQEAGASFDLAAGPLIRGRLIRLGEEEYVLLITMHHIVSDGWSMGVLVRELNALYKAFSQDKSDPLPELEIQYADYAVWQRQWMEGEILQQQSAYWKTTLAGAPSLLELPTDHIRPAQRDFAGGSVELALDEELTAGLKELSRRNGTTMYMTLLAGWAILLARLSGQQDVVIGSPVANRGRAEIENLIGFFVNTLALRLDLSGSPSVNELLEQTKAQSLAAQQHQDIPFEQVVELAQPVRSLAHSPLFQVMFAWNNATEGSLELPGLELRPFEPSPHRVAKFDMTLSLQATGDSIGGVVEYASALFEAASVSRYIGYFLELLKAMVADDAQSIDRLPMVSEGEREQVLYEWNETNADYPRGKCVHELFEEQAARTPQAVAVMYEEERLSYQELNQKANQLANYLGKLTVGPGVLVGICMHRSLEMIIGILGTLKAGAAYVPLDPAYPAKRLASMVEEVDLRVVLTTQELRAVLPEHPENKVRQVCLDGDWSQIASESSDNLPATVSVSNLCYVIFTSGSTGKAKAAAVSHGSWTNLMHWFVTEFNVRSRDKVLVISSFSFDITQRSIVMPLISGAQLHLLASSYYDPALIVQTIAEQGITRMNCAPSTFYPLVENTKAEFAKLRSLRTLFLGGEAISASRIREWAESPECCAEIANVYGAAECSDVSTFYVLKNYERYVGSSVPIGKPIFNTQIYLLDESLNPVAFGLPGEICIAGDGVGCGYINDRGLTEQKFVANPFSAGPPSRLYRTGDRGRFSSDGNLEFIGRVDHQVKLRGFRIDLGDIESTLRQHKEVKEAVVLAREDTAGEKRLVAYYTASGSGEGEAASVEVERLRAHLSAALPDYMVPTVFVELQKLPLNHNGKLDRKALPAPEQEAYAVRGYEAPVGEMETKLAEVWAEVLQLEKVGRHDNFFQLGGHSLLAVRVVSRLQQVLSVQVAVRDLFVHPGLADLARHLQGAAHAELSRIMPVQQQRLWFLPQMEEASERGVSHAVRPASEGRSQPHSSWSGSGPDIGSS